ncbi:MAG TPA: hypothetical protein PLN94_02535 [Thiolinea sp.]|nr:hypothetical protein [Thiolinea sp.]
MKKTGFWPVFAFPALFRNTAITTFNRITRKGTDMQPYQQLLAKAMTALQAKVRKLAC